MMLPIENSFAGFPDEVISEIFSLLEVENLGKVPLVCSRWKSISDTYGHRSKWEESMASKQLPELDAMPASSSIGLINRLFFILQICFSMIEKSSRFLRILRVSSRLKF
jgi:hypothetical protein